jgi:hypothetical protein
MKGEKTILLWLDCEYNNCINKIKEENIWQLG